MAANPSQSSPSASTSTRAETEADDVRGAAPPRPNEKGGGLSAVLHCPTVNDGTGGDKREAFSRVAALQQPSAAALYIRKDANTRKERRGKERGRGRGSAVIGS